MDRNFPEPEVTWVDVVLSCFNLKRVLNIAEDGRRKVKTRARLCNLRMLVWVYLRLLLFPTLWLPSVTYSVGGSVAVSLVLAYGALTGIIMAADLILFGWYLQFNVVVFVLLRFVPGCAIFAINFVMAFFAAFVLVRSLVESRNFDYRDLMAVAFYVGGLLLDILAYKIMKPIILHYSAWDNAVFDHKNELLIQYRGNLKKLETSYARKPDSVSDEVISVNTHDIMRLRFRVVVRKLFIKYVVRTLWSENLESEKRACSLDIRIRKLCSVFNTELLSENWSRCWICMVEALECLVLRAGASPQWMMSHGLVANVRWYNKLESQWAPTEELFSYYLKNLCFLCPASEMPSACEKVTFYCKYLDDEVKNMIILLEKLFEYQPDSLDTVKFMVGLNTSKQQRRLRRNTIPLICDAGLSLYRECLAKGESELADSWLALRFAERVELADLACLMKSTMEAVGMCGPRIQLNGNHEGVMKNYEVPVVNLKCSLQHRAKASWMQSSTSPKENLVSKHADPGSIVAESTSVDSTATTKVATSNSHDWFMNLSPEEQAEYSKQHCIVANRNAAELLVKSTRLSDDEMSKFPFTLVLLEDQDETIVLKWTVGGAERERKTNMKKNVPYHCLSLNYNAVENDWVISADWCRVEGLLDVEEEGASRIPLTGDSYPLLQMTSPLLKTSPFDLKSVFKQHKENREHTIDNYLGEVRSQSIARYYADRFQEATRDRFGYLRMLNSTFVVVFEDFERRSIIDMMVRERQVKDQHFEKFTNNGAFVNKNVNTVVLEAFSHFSHHESGGVLMVSDLQGWATQFIDAASTLDDIIILLTDPVIHCPSVGTKRFGLENTGEEGIQKFYSAIHPECNHICKELALKRPDGIIYRVRADVEHIFATTSRIAVDIHTGKDQDAPIDLAANDVVTVVGDYNASNISADVATGHNMSSEILIINDRTDRVGRDNEAFDKFETIT